MMPSDCLYSKNPADFKIYLPGFHYPLRSAGFLIEQFSFLLYIACEYELIQGFSQTLVNLLEHNQDILVRCVLLQAVHS